MACQIVYYKQQNAYIDCCADRLVQSEFRSRVLDIESFWQYLVFVFGLLLLRRRDEFVAICWKLSFEEALPDHIWRTHDH